MKLKAILISSFLALSSITHADEPMPQNLEIEEFGRKETGGVALKRGFSWGDGKKYTSTAASLLLDGYLAEFRLRQEETPRESSPDTLNIAGFTLSGTRQHRAYLSDFTFGIEIYELGRRWYDLKIYGQMTGGLQVVENNLFVDGERIPGDPDINFYGGGGTKTETVFRIPKIGPYYFSLGLGGLVEYLKDMNEFAEDPVNGINYGLYGLIRLSKDKIRQELRIKK